MLEVVSKNSDHLTGAVASCIMAASVRILDVEGLFCASRNLARGSIGACPRRSKKHVRRQDNMKKYVCDPCGYEYDPAVGDPDSGIAPGTAFEDLPEDWVCPFCGASKDDFSPVD